MKELTIEQKAKVYDEALERAKVIIRNYESRNLTNVLFYAKEYLSFIFPELKESEDEKIRKALVKHCREQLDIYKTLQTAKEYGEIQSWIAWLEKHKYTEEDLDKAYKCADEVQYRRGYEDAKKELEKQGEQKPAAWSEEDEELFTISLDNLIELNDRYGEEYGRVGECIRWFKSIKDRVQPQQKQEWSEEDKVKINRIVAFLENLNLKNLNIIDDNNTFKKDVNWLKSLKDRYTWKPSGEQLDALETAISSLQSTALESLYDKLKNL